LFAGEAAARHLFRVAAGLESTVAGENEILGQVRHAFREAASAASLDTGLARLFQAAIATGRRCRAGREPSGSSLAALAARFLLGQMTDGAAPVLVAGAGYMGSAIATTLASHRLPLIVASRSLERAGGVAERVGAIPATLEGAAALAPAARGVAVALGGPWVAEFSGPLPAVVDVSSPPALAGTRCRQYVDIDCLLATGAAAGADHDYAARAERVVESDLADYLERSGRRAKRLAG
jgi:glutamyl-tRNA reductase